MSETSAVLSMRNGRVEGCGMVVEDELEPHREGDRMLDGDLLEPPIPVEDADEWAEYDLEPTHEKWRRGRRWS